MPRHPLSRVMIICLIIGGGAAFIKHQLFSPLSLKEPISFFIGKGQGGRKIINDLAAHDLLHFPVGHRFILRLLGWDDQFQSGVYWLRPTETIMDIYEKFRTGADQVLMAVTLPEGLTTPQIHLLIDAAFSEGPALHVPHPTPDSMPHSLPYPIKGPLEPDAQPERSQEIVEAPILYLLPETYHFSAHTPRQTILMHLKTAGEQILDLLWATRSPDCHLLTPSDAVILASIVEKETRLPHERARVARVFLNRLHKKMPLQADPTVAYGLHLETGRPLELPLRRVDLSHHSPYNTYVNKGLPPAPICHPGKEALQAVLHPAPGKELYFVADGTGGHTFSETYQAHAVHHQRWRKIQRQKLTSPLPHLSPQIKVE